MVDVFGTKPVCLHMFTVDRLKKDAVVEVAEKGTMKSANTLVI